MSVNNFERIKDMNINELADFLDDLVNGRVENDLEYSFCSRVTAGECADGFCAYDSREYIMDYLLAEVG